MSSVQVERPLKVENSEERTTSKNKSRSKENEKSQKNSMGHFPKKHKHENDGRNFKFGRKRSQSFSAGGRKFFPPYKRRKKEGTIIPPTKFLLGGNIYDPLNLNSLQDEEINRAMNAVTPKSSPLPTPRHRKGQIEVIIPPNLHDPLNLISCEDDAEYEQQLVSPTKRCRKSRNRKKKRNSSSGGSAKEDGPEIAAVLMNVDATKASDDEKETAANVVVAEAVSSSVSTQENPARRELNFELPLKEKEQKTRKASEDSCGGKDKAEKKWKADPKDKIVSPVIPQPGAWKRPPQYGHRGGNGAAAEGRFNRFRPGGHWHNKKGQQSQPLPNFKKKDAYFQYGNYLRYYGYRNPQHEDDVRLKFFASRKDLFQDRDVLDIGCNIGHVTLIIARDFGARSVAGLDIDRKLISIARKNVRHYINGADSPPNNDSGGGERDSKFFPISMPILYGPVDIPGISHGQSPSASRKFPHNVTFVQGNYVLDSDTLLATEQPQFDVILCLSVTKWVHLNWGDAGLKQAFKRMYLQLRPGGHLILEAQAWESYKRKKNLTETIFKNYHSIEFFPQKFTEYLLSSEVGFTKCEVIGTPYHHSKGFQRPIQLFTKGTRTPVSWSSSRETDEGAGQSNTNTPLHMNVSKTSQPPVYVAVVMSSRETDDDDTAGQSNTNTPSHSVVSGSSQTPIYTAVRMSTRETDDYDVAGESNTNTPSHIIEPGTLRPPVYTAVSMSTRETDDDDAGVESNTNTPSYVIEPGTIRPPIYTAVSMSTRETDDDDAGESNTNTPSHVIEQENLRPPVYTAVSMSTRETDDDDAGVESNTTTPSHMLESETTQARVYTTIGRSAREIDDDAAGEINTNTFSQSLETETLQPPLYTSGSMPVRETDDDTAGQSGSDEIQEKSVDLIFTVETDTSEDVEEKNVSLMETENKRSITHKVINSPLQETNKTDIIKEVDEANTNIENYSSPALMDNQQNSTIRRDGNNVYFDKSSYENNKDNIIYKKGLKYNSETKDCIGTVSTKCDNAFETVTRDNYTLKVASSDITQEENDISEIITEDNSANVHLNVCVEDNVPENMSSDDKNTERAINVDANKEKLHNEDGELNIKSDCTSPNET